ncbi:hypothetical protein Vretimale_3681 [Volvox reticuliferus]|nr:hypothetical protein Vretimale_3681 [Volvox reticuliferus]
MLAELSAAAVTVMPLSGTETASMSSMRQGSTSTGALLAESQRGPQVAGRGPLVAAEIFTGPPQQQVSAATVTLGKAPAGSTTPMPDQEPPVALPPTADTQQQGLEMARFNLALGPHFSAPYKLSGRGRGTHGGPTGRGYAGGRDPSRGHGHVQLTEEAKSALKAANICTHCYGPWGKGHRCFKRQRKEDQTGGQQVAHGCIPAGGAHGLAVPIPPSPQLPAPSGE